MGIFDFLFGNKNDKIRDFMSRGAVIVDVRSKKEYDSGAIPGSKHIPLPEISSKISEIKKWDKPVILCCASGVRSGSASGILKSNGVEAINGGGWFNLSKKI
ncbi:rhodanese-like domain-containing protein [Ulvibacter sp. MAR_2010_11]|uniref:rhodanese-like domain-containing protein n=1 Tax=Ulvibacter sp. MAR_2010_11 TaxID=1250229 RepID=UPI000C2B5876|nr:rhodanese-like domain-containing protein [Ulvibacter sp. MAR_2010_11]PKA83354.1 rhodanese-like domain-containing protein [Ulvibacter sp. MAR_2010_11]